MVLSRIAFGSCNSQELVNNLWPVVESRRPAAFVWGGDAIYGDSPSYASGENLIEQNNLFVYFPCNFEDFVTDKKKALCSCFATCTKKRNREETPPSQPTRCSSSPARQIRVQFFFKQKNKGRKQAVASMRDTRTTKRVLRCTVVSSRIPQPSQHEPNGLWDNRRPRYGL